MISNLKATAKHLLGIYPKWVCRREYRSQRFRWLNERPVELAFIFKHMTRLFPKTVLDVGTGTTALPHLLRNCGCLVTAMDNISDYWPTGMVNRHYHVVDDNITAPRLTGSFDLITCISCLEHIEDSDAAYANMMNLLEPGGHLILTFPYTERRYVENVYALPGSSYGSVTDYVCRSYSREVLDRWLARAGGTIVDQEYWRIWSGDCWSQGERVAPPAQTNAGENHTLTCVLIRK